jgi:hypothetical protein
LNQLWKLEITGSQGGAGFLQAEFDEAQRAKGKELGKSNESNSCEYLFVLG